VQASATGQVINIITDEQAGDFGIGSSGALKNAVGRYFGQNPDDAWLKSPATNGDWGDLYNTYGWSQVQAVLIPTKTEVLSVSTNQSTAARTVLQNTSHVKGTFTANLETTKSDTVSSSWNNSFQFHMGQKISTKVNIIPEVWSVGGELSFDETWTWGEGGSKENSVSFSSGNSISADLEPGQSAVATLSITAGQAKVRVTYQASLRGAVAVNYGGTYKGHHFYGLPIGGIAGQTITITQDLDVGFFTNAKVVLSDAENNAAMLLATPGAHEMVAGKAVPVAGIAMAQLAFHREAKAEPDEKKE
jgi:hypothetical protein